MYKLYWVYSASLYEMNSKCDNADSKCHKMSNLNIKPIASTIASDPEEVLESDGKRMISVTQLTSETQYAPCYSCDDEDNDVTVVKVKEGCEQKELNMSTTGSTIILDSQLEKMHIASNDLTSNTTIIPRERSCICPAGTKPKNRKMKSETNQKIRTCEIDDTKLESDYDNLKGGNCVKERRGVHVGMPLLETSSKKNNSSVLHSDVQGNCSFLKQLPPTLLKSQSLDLCNDDCTFLNIDQKLHSCALPNINEYRSTDSQMQSPTNEEKQIDNKIQLESTGDTTQHDPQQQISTTNFHSSESRPIYPNVPYSPYGSPYGSPRSVRRRPPLRESRRVSIEKSGSFLQLNQYKLMDQIGQGSYGLVKLAYSEEDSTHYAMKILSKKRLLRQAALMRRSPKQATSPLDRVYREIAVLKKLDHPNIVKLVEVLDDPMEDSLYMVFELVKNGEVLCIPTDKPLPEERAWSVFRDSLLGLEYLHYQKIIHADLKPGNLLLTQCGHVKIADFGVCNEFLGEDAIMSNGSTAGTPAFRAPETLVLGKNVYCGRAADIWALGATLFSLVYGNVPFVANSIPLLYEKIKNEKVIFPEASKISEYMQDCILRMLEKNASNRITLPQLKINSWVTNNGMYPLPTEDENCCLVQVDDEDINSVVRSIPKLDTLILIKTMLKNHSFGNPFIKGISGRAPQPGGSRLQKFIQAGRSNSAPGSYHMAFDRQPSTDNALPSLTEHCPNQSNEDL